MEVVESLWELWGRLTCVSCSNDCESKDGLSSKVREGYFEAGHCGVTWLSWSTALISKPDLESQRGSLSSTIGDRQDASF